jgi:dTDP-glucose pyrophosphorylase
VPQAELLKRDALVSAGASLRDAMLMLNTGIQIALVVDDLGRLVGTVTDGDVRRALLAGAAIDGPLAPHMQRRFTTVPPEAPRAEVLDLMRARSIQGIPIVDEQQRVVGLHLMREIVGTVERPNWAVVMAGGQGTRLRPLTAALPKPMVSVAGRPILERIVLHLVGFGIRRIFLAIHYLGHKVEEHFGDGARFGARVEYLREPVPLGSGGALSLLPQRPADPLLVMNGALVTQANVAALLDFHGREGVVASVGVRPYQHRVPFGAVETDGARVRAVEEKPVVTRLINAGLYVLQPELAGRVPSGSEFGMPSLIEDCLSRGEPVGAFPIEDDWIDVGQADQLRLARGGEA